MADALRFLLGPSSSGKTGLILEEMIGRSIEEPERSLLLIVPDQFTLASQIEMVNKHPYHVITNIDVLSFGRLSHRILEETGHDRAELIDDTGKSLIIRREAAAVREDIPFLEKYLKRPGYIHEIKSILSEFMLYGVGETDLARASADPALPLELRNRLADLSTVYGKFVTALGTEYTTREDRLMVLANAVPGSETLRGARVYFDGFTGFTPLQVNVIREMLSVCEQVTVSLLWDHGVRDVTAEAEEEALFHMSRQTIDSLSEAAGDLGTEFLFSEVGAEGKDSLLSPGAQAAVSAPEGDVNSSLALLEKHLFREIPLPGVPQKPDNIKICRYRDQRSEIEGCAREILRCIRDKGYAYGDIAVITGDLSGYAEELQDVFSSYGIPVYMDYTRGVSGNALSVFIRSALEIVDNAFRADSVMRFLRTGFAFGTDAPAPDQGRRADAFELYIRRRGLRGKNSYLKPFSGDQADPSEQVRTEMMRILEPLLRDNKTVNEWIRAVYEMLLRAGCAEKLGRLSEEMKARKELQLSGEYEQIYGYIIDLLDTFVSLMGDEEVTVEEFRGLFEAGISELRVGTIPQDQDRVVAGDLERTRINSVKALFVLGCDDESLQNRTVQGGLFSETDRELLAEAGLTLSPTPQELMFSQRMYLYMNLTKARDQLYLSWPDTGGDMASRRPSYLIAEIRRIFEGLEVLNAVSIPEDELLVFKRDAYTLLSSALRASLERDRDGGRDLGTAAAVIKAFRESGAGSDLPEKTVERAYHVYAGKPIPAAAVEGLYGTAIRTSVSRIEAFQQCPYMYFLEYGLGLGRTVEYGITPLDTGSYIHKALENFGILTFRDRVQWKDLTDEAMLRYARAAEEKTAGEASAQILSYFGTTRGQYVRKRLFRIFMKSVGNIRHHFSGGSFLPAEYEVKYRDTVYPDDEGLVNKGFSISLSGTIDRIDRAVLEGVSYLRVVDYKTGSKTFSLDRIRAGLDVQLPLYLDYALRMENRKGAKAFPAGMFYYHTVDKIFPVNPGEITAEKAAELDLKNHRLDGSVVADEKVASLMMREGEEGIIPKVFNMDKTPNKQLKDAVVTEEEMRKLLLTAEKAVKQTGKEIISGRVEARPFKDHNGTACGFCAFRSACVFDGSLPGYRVRTLPKNRINGGSRTTDQTGAVGDGIPPADPGSE